MIINPFSFVMKDGRTALIRSPREEDIPGMLDYLYVSAAETDFLLRCPEDQGRYTPEKEKIVFDRFNASENEAMLVCLVDGKMAGNCQITWTDRPKTRHRAQIAIALLKAYWGQGIGTRMIQELIRIAEANENILQMELEFIEGNVRARALYEKMGFRITGVRPNAIRLTNGTLLHEYTMIRPMNRPLTPPAVAP